MAAAAAAEVRALSSSSGKGWEIVGTNRSHTCRGVYKGTLSARPPVMKLSMGSIGWCSDAWIRSQLGRDGTVINYAEIGRKSSTPAARPFSPDRIIVSKYSLCIYYMLTLQNTWHLVASDGRVFWHLGLWCALAGCTAKHFSPNAMGGHSHNRTVYASTDCVSLQDTRH